MTENEISYKIIGAIYKVYNELGPGFYLSRFMKQLCAISCAKMDLG